MGKTAIGNLGVCLLLALAVGCEGDKGDPGAQGPPGQPGAPGDLGADLTTLEKALVGVGGRVPLIGMSGFEIQATGARGLVGEGFSAGDSAFEASTFAVTVSRDLVNDNMRLDYTRQFAVGPVTEISYTEIINGNLGFVAGRDSVFEAAGTSEEMLTARMASARRQQRLLNPHLILLDVLDSEDPIATEAGVAFFNDSIHELLVVEDSVSPITLWVNASTGRISRLTTLENDFLHRDSELRGSLRGLEGLRRRRGLSPRCIHRKRRRRSCTASAAT